MPQHPDAPGVLPPRLHPVYAAQLAAVRKDPTAPSTTWRDQERGWLVASGAARILEPFVTDLPHDDDGLARFAGVAGTEATALLACLDPRELDDRQNGAPTLGTLLRAAAAHPDELEVHGYAVGPARIDERISAEGVDLYALPVLDVRADHDDDCQCELLWHLVVDLLEVDDQVPPPDEIHQRVNPWRPRETCWRLWWD